MPGPTTTVFEDAIDVPIWLEADRETPYLDKSRRDREIARSIPAGDPISRVRAWWRAIRGADADGSLGVRLERIRGLVAIAMAIAGALAGMAVALAAFRYDGSQPVNVVRLLALLVGFQLLLVVTTLLLMPGRVIGLRTLQDGLAAINPGAIATSLFRRIARLPPDLERMFDWHASRASAGRFAKWQLLYWSQISAVAFNVAALVTAILLVTFTDLAFGWSTTLQAEPPAVTRLAQALAWPWHTIAPWAVPTPELVEQSQFFRYEGNGVVRGGIAPRALTGWWPFTIFAIVTYGLLPRLVLLMLAAYRLRAATAALLIDDPRVTALLDRMNAPEIETFGDDDDSVPEDVTREVELPPLAGAAQAVIWEAAVTPDAARSHARTLGLDLAGIVEAGGASELSADEAALTALGSSAPRSLVVITPAWEPPLLDLLDFLEALRRKVGKDVSIVVMPVADDPARGVSAVEKQTWTRAIGRLADPQLYVETGAA